MIGFKWTAAQIEWLCAHYPSMRTADCIAHIGCTAKQLVYKVTRLGLHKSEAWMKSEESPLFMAGKTLKGKRTQFKAGIAPWNKGIPYQAGGRSEATRFAPGHVPHTWHPIGHHRHSKEGYLQIKIADTGVTYRDYVPAHHLLWRMHGLSVLPGHALVFKNGDKDHIDINNLELIPRAELLRRNSAHRHGPEIARISQLIGCINRQLRQKEKSQNA